MTPRRLLDERGSAMLFVTALMVFLFVMAGVAIDVSYLATSRQELRRSMDAAALAGAGKLGFNESYFSTARDFAQSFAAKNLYRNPWGGTITLDRNDGNEAGGNIVLGIWDPTRPPAERFTASLDETRVNAVLCRYTTTIPTSFLNLLGLTSLPVQAGAIAITNPPATVPPNACVFPIGVTACSFQDAGAFNSQGCGAPITFISSSGATPGTAGGTNTAAWVNINGTGTPNAPSLNEAINAAANGSGCNGSSLGVGDDVGTNNGMIQSVFNNFEDHFVTKFNSSPIYTVKNSDGVTTYEGKGWEVYVPLISSECPPGPISGNHQILGWSRFVMTQVIRNQQGPQPRCVVENPADWNSAPLCTDPTLHESVRGIFGFFECSTFNDVQPVVEPGPIAALAEHVKLVR